MHTPIGDDGTWYRLSYVYSGIALAIPFVWSMIEFVLTAVMRSNAGRIASGMVLLISFYWIGETLEVLA